jgi:hypothetical protein
MGRWGGDDDWVTYFISLCTVTSSIRTGSRWRLFLSINLFSPKNRRRYNNNNNRKTRGSIKQKKKGRRRTGVGGGHTNMNGHFTRPSNSSNDSRCLPFSPRPFFCSFHFLVVIIQQLLTPFQVVHTHTISYRQCLAGLISPAEMIRSLQKKQSGW